MFEGLLSMLGMGGGGGALPPFAGQPDQPPPQAAQPPSPGIGDRLFSGITGFLDAPSTLGGVSNLLKGLAGQPTSGVGARTQQMKAVYDSLRANGLSDADARAAVSNQKVLETLLPRVFPQHSPFSQGQTYGSFNPTTGKVNIQGATPALTKLNAGETAGFATPTVLPQAPAPNDPTMTVPPSQVAAANAPAAPSVRFADGSTAPAGSPTSLPPATPGFQPVASGGSVLQNSSDQSQGKAQGEARATYPETVASITKSLDNIRELKNNPSLWYNTGWRRPLSSAERFLGIGGEESSEFSSRLDQLKAQNWTNAVKALQGMGALSNAEGSRIEQAAARLQTDNPEAFKKALTELENGLMAGITRARMQAGLTTMGQQRLQGGGASVPPPPNGFQVIQ